MQYWLTTRYPSPDGPEEHPNISVYDGVHDHVVDRIQPGDWVFVYETRTGPTTIGDDSQRYRGGREGREGIVALSRVTSPLEKKDDNWVTYADKPRKNWCWRAATSSKEKFDGFVARRDVCRIMGWKLDFKLRGLGRGSGVIEI